MKLVAGSSGVLGSGFIDLLRARGEQATPMVLPWGDPGGVASRVLEYWQAARALGSDEPVTMIWAAGTGTVSAPDQAMALETRTLMAVVDALAAGTSPDPDSILLFASSAGALYGGHRGGLIRSTTPPCPITPYGREKMLQEQSVARLSELGVMRTVSCRFTNIYGLSSGRLRRKGLVAALVYSALLRQPARIFVNPDTRRDYLFGTDAAALALAEAEASGPGASLVTTVQAGTTMTILDLVESISRVLRRRVPVVFTESAESVLQPLVLRFPARTGVQATVATNTFEAAIKRMVGAPLSLG